ncbi:alpha-L-fucosidase [Rhizosphaericola mali]|uniref:alpha-L-fucosidase n=1 Tax=Rhizosphaericola mali TaxID=2545455 RepID=A0A5P2G4Y6_9BACT|nr:alpha-L-fucosidase [Rhizosphaericola mali]QES88153.1 hypothetical protein E0W69_005560 [Rhizosphaericola mali]
MKLKNLKIRFYTNVLVGAMLIANNISAQNSNYMQWWKDAIFGLFLHWGLYSATAGDWKGHPTSRGEQFMMVERIPIKEYVTIADTFNPIHFNADKWVKMAKDAGMKYIIITSKHHDGFAMYDSKVSDFNIVKKTPYAHDPLKDLIIACHKNGLKFGFYYSLGRDWEDPDAATDYPQKGGRSNTWDFPNEDAKDVTKYLNRKAIPQIKELVTNYGKVDVLWFDTPELTPKSYSKRILDTIRKYQPDCIVNSRIGNGYGDYLVNEQKIEDNVNPKPWESCVTISQYWAYNKHDTAWKSTNTLARQLSEIISKGGNYLLNLSPKADGTFATQSEVRMDSLGKWIAINKEAIYGTKPWIITGELDSSYLQRIPERALTAKEKDILDAVNDRTSKALYPEYRFTTSGKTIFVFVNNPASLQIRIKSLADNISSSSKISLIGYSKKINFSKESDDWMVQLPKDFKPIIPMYVLKIIP